MKWNRGCLIGILLAGGLLGGCAENKTLQTKALAPTAEEARSIAQAQLDQQANELMADKNSKGGYQVTGAAHFSTKVLPQANGGQVYEVTGTEHVSRQR